MSLTPPTPVQIHDIEWNDEQVSRLWNYYARTEPYSELYFAKLFGHWLLLEAALPAQAPLDILDFGCGPGFMWEHIRDRFPAWFYTGLDFSAESIAATCARGDGEPRFRGAIHVTNLPTNLPSESFDVVLLIEVVEHLHDRQLESTLKEVTRVLRRGGVIVISTPNQEDLSRSKKLCPECGAIFHEWQHVRSLSEASLISMIEQLGFRTLRRVTTNFVEKGWRLNALAQRLLRYTQLLFGRVLSAPHLLAVFQKI